MDLHPIIPQDLRTTASPTFADVTATEIVEAGTGFKCGGTAAVADGTYTVGIGITANGTITTKGGIIIAVQEAS